MKNILLFTAIFSLSLVSSVGAQSNKFTVSAGIGYDPTVRLDGATVNAIPLTVKVGYQFSPMFSLNAVGGHSATTSQLNIINDGLALQTATAQTFLGLRGELKKGFSERFEVYGGAMFGYVNKEITEQTANGETYNRPANMPTQLDPSSKGQFLYSGFVGSNFYLLKHVGLFAEIGYGVSLLNGGVTVRF